VERISSGTFFVAERGGRLLRHNVYRVFWRLSREIGLRRRGDRTGPRVHDFRHSSGTPIIPATGGELLHFPGDYVSVGASLAE
jgi:hypothetical protein